MIDKKDQISKFRHTFIFQMNMVESIARRRHFSTCCCVSRCDPRLFFVVIVDVSRIRLQELNMLHPDEGFRLWMTAEVHPKFPTVLLQTSLKVTYEVRTQGHIERGSSAGLSIETVWARICLCCRFGAWPFSIDRSTTPQFKQLYR